MHFSNSGCIRNLKEFKIVWWFGAAMFDVWPLVVGRHEVATGGETFRYGRQVLGFPYVQGGRHSKNVMEEKVAVHQPPACRGRTDVVTEGTRSQDRIIKRVFNNTLCVSLRENTMRSNNT